MVKDGKAAETGSEGIGSAERGGARGLGWTGGSGLLTGGPALTRRGFAGALAASAALAPALGLLPQALADEAAAGQGGSQDAGQQNVGDAGSDASQEAPASDDGWSTHREQRDPSGSPDPVQVRVGLIMGPPSMGLSNFILDAQAGSTANTFDFTLNGVDYVGLSAAFNQGDYDICTLPSNIGPILYNNRDLKNEYRVISVNNLGVLYVITTDVSISGWDGLAGKTVYAYGEGGTPEYTVEALLKKTGLDGSFNLEFKSTPFEILNMLIDVPNTIAILPQPFVALAQRMVTDGTVYVPIDITAEWDKAFADTGSQAVTVATIVNKQFLDEHEQAVIEYLQRAGDSIAWSQANIEEAASRQEDLGTFLNNEVAAAAMPYIDMVNLVGEEMRSALSGFVEELYEANPDSVGGAVPGEDFYYLPPAGAVESVLPAGKEGQASGEGASGSQA